MRQRRQQFGLRHAVRQRRLNDPRVRIGSSPLSVAPPSVDSCTARSSPRLRSRSRAISQSEIRCEPTAAERISLGAFSRP